VSLEADTREAILAALSVPKSFSSIPITATNTTTTTPIAPTSRPVTPLIQLEHLVLDCIYSIRPAFIHAFFDCLAYHQVRC